jgi:hypothetical protein
MTSFFPGIRVRGIAGARCSDRTFDAGRIDRTPERSEIGPHFDMDEVLRWDPEEAATAPRDAVSKRHRPTPAEGGCREIPIGLYGSVQAPLAPPHVLSVRIDGVELGEIPVADFLP